MEIIIALNIKIQRYKIKQKLKKLKYKIIFNSIH